MNILRTVYYCRECEKVFSRTSAPLHKAESDHTLSRHLEGNEPPIKESVLIEDDIKSPKFSSKRVLKSELEKLIREEYEHHRRMQLIFNTFRRRIGIPEVNYVENSSSNNISV